MSFNKYYSDPDHWLSHLRTYYFNILLFFVRIKVWWNEFILGKYPGLLKGERFPIWKKLK